MSGGEEDVNPLLNKTECFCLNESSSSPHSNVIELGSSLLTSNDDEQLLLHLSLRQTVKLTSIVFTSPSDESCPQTVQLFVNKNNLDFGQASELVPTQSITLPPGGGTVKVPLQAVKWTKCDSITIFVVDNYGNDVTSLQYVQLFGKPLAGTNVAEIKPC